MTRDALRAERCRSAAAHFRPRHGGLAFLLAAILMLGAATAAQGAFTLSDERKLGKEFYDNLEKHQAILHDQRAAAYLSAVGNMVLANSEKLPYDYRFSIIKSSAVNAFATPGGYVYVNRGLLTLVESESELASVLAHEIAHINARHIADSIEKSKKLNIAALAGILAGAFLGVGSDLGAAAVTFPMAAMQAMNLKYSREHEEEADRLGLGYLVSAGYDGKSALDFLKILRRYEFYSNSIPSYFLTHPGTEDRIRYLDAMLQTVYTRRGKEAIVGNLKRIQTLLILQDKDYQKNLKHFQDNLRKNPRDADDLFGLAVTQERLGQTADSIRAFHEAHSLAPSDPDILREMGGAYLKAGKSKEAVPYLQEAVRGDPENVTTLLYLAQAYEAQGRKAEAIAIFKEIERKTVDDEDVFYAMATIYGQNNRLYESHYYFGRYFKKRNRRESALHHFQAALKHAPADGSELYDIQKEIMDLKSPDGKKKEKPTTRSY
ncbi:MAG: M48 family metalloprotease [Pseudomonadota bacterium]|nr:M48 family metalloprotease [Pseudomonadota bacterium]